MKDESNAITTYHSFFVFSSRPGTLITKDEKRGMNND